MKKAWLIGIDYLENSNISLRGSITDINNIRNMLIDAYKYNPENIVFLRDDVSTNFILPTRANILEQFKIMIEESKYLEEIWFHYSGHGSKMQDSECNSENIEVIIPVDYKENGVIYDYEIIDFLKEIKCRILLFFDCFHSGKICELPYIHEYVNGELITTVINNNIMINNKTIL